MSRRVVVTGMGAITPIGNSVDDFWKNAKAGKIGIAPLTAFDSTEYKAKLAAEVKDFDPKDYMDPKTARRMERFAQFAIVSSKEAIEDSGLDMEKEDPYMVGVCIGSGIGSLQAIEKNHVKLLGKGPNRVAPLMIPSLIGNMAAGSVAIEFGLQGKNFNVVTACATGTHSIGEAYRSIQYGEADVMVAGGTEAAITPLGMAGFTSMTALNTTEDVTLASIPFDERRAGFVMGEGSGVLILEELEHAKKRNAKIYAEVAGYGASCDAFHITSPAEDGSGAAKSMEFAMKDAGVTPAEVDYINAHGTSTHMNDLFETRAIKLAFGDEAYKVKVNSTKSMVGHLLGAAGGVEAITCIKSIQDQFLHENVGLEKQDPECDLNVIKGKGQSAKVDVTLSNSLGFGGHNATLIIKKYEA